MGNKENYVIGVLNNEGHWTEQEEISVRRDFLTDDILSELRRRFYICAHWDVTLKFCTENKTIVGYVSWGRVLLCAVRKVTA